jgi:hypothetical protein
MRRNSSCRRVAIQQLPLRKLAVAGAYLCAIVMLAAATGGCSCSQDADPNQQAAEAKKKLEEKQKQERKPDFEFKPSYAQPLPSDERQNIFIKPGHWVAVTKGMRANNFDFDGQATWTPVTSSNARVGLDRTGYRMSMSRPLYLAKNQKRFKNIEMTLFAPAHRAQQTKFEFDLVERGGRGNLKDAEIFRHLDDHEYFMVVLAHEPDRYAFLHDLDSIKPPTASEFNMSDSTTYYQVLRPKIDQHIPLSSSVLTWTSIAYVVWDDVDPGRLMSEQQQAMIDWLHWGGQILVSGPESLDKLRGSFLEPYLPVSSKEADKLSGEDFEEINQEWTFDSAYRRIHQRPLQAKAEPWSAVRLELKDGIGDENVLAATPEFGPERRPLVVEQRVGRGRVVVTAFRLRERDLRTWPGFDNFFNGCLLRRPSRIFERPEEMDFGGTAHVEWSKQADIPLHRLDPSYVTAVRFFSRDAGYQYQPYQPTAEYDQWDTRPAGPGLGGWSDFNAVSNAARDTIRAAAGIEIPTPSFVATVLFFYLIVLVPLNWTVFRVVNRIELAWVAAPVISLLSAGLVIKLADLNIGFARSETDIVVVEAQDGYSRAHVARFTAVYTSLSTPYGVEFDDANAQAQPFALRSDFRLESGKTPPTVSFDRTNKVTLTGFHVDSNSTGLMHSEQFVDLGGKFALLKENGDVVGVTNLTNYGFERAFLVRRDSGGGENQFMRLGDLTRGGTARGVFESRDAEQFMRDWASDGETTGQLILSQLVRLAASFTARTDDEDEDIRLVAVNFGDPVPGMTIAPTASQRRSAMILLANLNDGKLPDPQHDKNVRWDVAKPQSHTVGPDSEVRDGEEQGGDEELDR